MNRSGTIGSIAAALAKAQSSIGTIVKDRKVDAGRMKYSYADLASVNAVVLPALNANGISVMQGDDGNGFMVTLLAHESGEWIETRTPMFEGQNGGAQGYGSGATYARRYGLMAAVGAAPDDDDGAAASGPLARKGAAQKPPDAWECSILDHLPADATGEERAKAFAEAIAYAFTGYKTEANLNKWWMGKRKYIDKIEANYPDIHAWLVDRFEMRRNEITEEKAA